VKVYVDADILIWHLRGKPEATDFLRSLQSKAENELFVGAMQRAEIVFFMREAEIPATLRLLRMFQTAPIDQAIVDRAGDLFRRYQPSHGTDANDALLAATILHTGGKLYTLNTQHFPIPDLIVERPW
jgi:predicted nucleic acid-binding protein